MSNKLSVVTFGQVVDEDVPFLETVQRAVDKNRAEIIRIVKKWILYWAEEGVTYLVLENCEHLSEEGLRVARAWLEKEGFKVSRPRVFRPKTIIYLEGSEDL